MNPQITQHIPSTLAGSSTEPLFGEDMLKGNSRNIEAERPNRGRFSDASCEKI
jgi:hypothetical protein